MKKIELKKVLWFEVGVNGEAVDTAQVVATRQQFDHNAKEVIFAALGIESVLKNEIMRYFVDAGKGEFFHSVVLSSDQFSFSFAIRVFIATLKRLHTIPVSKAKEKKLKELDDHLRKVMHYRNAVTHGRLFQKRDKVVLKYFQGVPREDEITDAYWTKLESHFKKAQEMLHMVTSNAFPTM